MISPHILPTHTTGYTTRRIKWLCLSLFFLLSFFLPSFLPCFTFCPTHTHTHTHHVYNSWNYSMNLMKFRLQREDLHWMSLSEFNCVVYWPINLQSSNHSYSTFSKAGDETEKEIDTWPIIHKIGCSFFFFLHFSSCSHLKHFSL